MMERLNSYIYQCIAGVLCLMSASLAWGDATPEELSGPAFKFVPGAAWQEKAGDLPPPPKEADLLEVPLGVEGFDFTVYLDGTSLVLGQDRVLRYTVILESANGVRNGFREGMRCETGEYRRYAYLDGQGHFDVAGATGWQAISSLGFGRFRTEFFNFHLCNPPVAAWPVETILRRLKYGWSVDDEKS